MLSWARRDEMQRAQKVVLYATEENKEFDAVKKHGQQNNATDNTKAIRKVTQSNCTYCSNIHES